MANTICHFEIPVGDPQGASKFYGDLFGWTITSASAENEDYLFIKTSDQPDALGGGMHKPVAEGQGVTVYVKVESVDEMCKKVAELGGVIITAKTVIAGFGYVAVFLDPQGNAIGLFQNMED